MPTVLTLPAAIKHARLFRLDGGGEGAVVPIMDCRITLAVPGQVAVLKLAR